jgi:hypothetical protein
MSTSPQRRNTKNKDPTPAPLFDEEDTALDRTIDRLSAQYGTGIVSRGEREFTAKDAEYAEKEAGSSE